MVVGVRRERRERWIGREGRVDGKRRMDGERVVRRLRGVR